MRECYKEVVFQNIKCFIVFLYSKFILTVTFHILKHIKKALSEVMGLL